MNKIILIREVYSIKPKNNWNSYAGFEVILEDGSIIYVLVSDGQSCCENWGYVTTNDNVDDFKGAELLDIKLTDKALSLKNLDSLLWNGKISIDAGGIQFVDFITNRGTLQLAVYNSHNGYYGHDILIMKDNETLLEDVL